MDESCHKYVIHFRDLILCGVLSGRAEDSWWISIPNAGLFVNTLMRGRAALLKVIKKCKYKEILKEVSLKLLKMFYFLGSV